MVSSLLVKFPTEVVLGISTEFTPDLAGIIRSIQVGTVGSSEKILMTFASVRIASQRLKRTEVAGTTLGRNRSISGRDQ